jgi:hypothetical protein
MSIGPRCRAERGASKRTMGSRSFFIKSLKIALMSSFQNDWKPDPFGAVNVVKVLGSLGPKPLVGRDNKVYVSCEVGAPPGEGAVGNDESAKQSHEKEACVARRVLHDVLLRQKGLVAAPGWVIGKDDEGRVCFGQVARALNRRGKVVLVENSDRLGVVQVVSASDVDDNAFLQ